MDVLLDEDSQHVLNNIKITRKTSVSAKGPLHMWFYLHLMEFQIRFALVEILQAPR